MSEGEKEEGVGSTGSCVVVGSCVGARAKRFNHVGAFG